MEQHDSPYSLSRIRTGLRNLLLGKALTTLGGIGALVLVVRGLPVEHFAAYSIMLGLVEVLAVATSVGTGQVMTRYIPELHVLGLRHAIRGLVSSLSALRMGILVVTLVALAAFIAPVSRWLDLGDWQQPLLWYLLVVLFRTGSTTLFQVLESMLHQGQGQSAFATITLARCAGVAILYATDSLSLSSLVLVEVAAEFIGLLLMGWHVRATLRAEETMSGTEPSIQAVPSRAEAAQRAATDAPATDTPATDTHATETHATDTPATETPAQGVVSASAERHWLADNSRRMTGYGIKAYLQHMISMPFSGVVNRLVVGGAHLATPEVALFGFAQSILDLMERYLPAQLFVGLIRPVMVARWSSTGSIDDPAMLTNASLKLNLALIGIFASVLLAGGESMLLDVTRGRYGEQAMWLVLLMCLLVAVDSWRHVLDQLCQTVERYGFLSVSNTVLGLSLFGGLALLPVIGVAGLPVANCIGAVFANLLTHWWLRHSGIPFRHDLRGIAAIGLALTISLIVAWLSHRLADAWWLRAPIVALIALVLIGAALWFDRPLRATLVAMRQGRR